MAAMVYRVMGLLSVEAREKIIDDLSLAWNTEEIIWVGSIEALKKEYEYAESTGSQLLAAIYHNSSSRPIYDISNIWKIVWCTPVIIMDDGKEIVGVTKPSLQSIETGETLILSKKFETEERR